MDGNSTWAKKNNKTTMDGYLKGMRTMSDVIISAKELGIKYVTFYAFSSENWKRPSKWVSDFMKLALWFFKNDESIKKVLNADAKLKIIGDKSKLDSEIQDILNEYEERTKGNDGITVQLAISYGSQDEIVRAVKKIAENKIDFTIENISNNLDTAGIPDPDLIIRTSAKQRLSNFLLWQASYSEFYFSILLWPEFDKVELQNAIDDFLKRGRTFGK